MTSLSVKTQLMPAVLALACVGVYGWTVAWKNANAQPRHSSEMHVAMPAFIQLMFAFGDRYLAANAGVFRSQTVGTHELSADSYSALAKVQLVSAQLNPMHEDNYYTAAAILPWNGHLDEGQLILTYATDARKTDATPPFFRGFNTYHFTKDYLAAGKDLLLAAERSSGGNGTALRSIASRWIERGYDPVQSREVIRSMAESSSDPRLINLLNARAARLDGVIALQAAASAYRQKVGHVPTSLEDLVRQGVIQEIPMDPMGIGYVLDDKGVPQIASRSHNKAQ